MPNALSGMLNSLSAKSAASPDTCLSRSRLVAVHSDVLHYPGVRHAGLFQFRDDVGHEFYRVRPTGPVVADGRGHAVGEVLIYHNHRKHPLFPLVYPVGGLHHHVAVVAVHEFVDVVFAVVVTYARRGVAVLPDGEFEELHFGRCHHVGIVGIGAYLRYGYGDDVVNGAFVSVHRFQEKILL